MNGKCGRVLAFCGFPHEKKNLPVLEDIPPFWAGFPFLLE
jgi:hypothetical protein